MASHDLRRILTGWDYESNQVTVRKVAGDDGAVKIQLRLPLGLLQMEVSGRPDGSRPFGFESLLEYQEHRLQEHVRKNGTDLGFEIAPEDARLLRDETEMYYHRYLAEFVLEDFAGVDEAAGTLATSIQVELDEQLPESSAVLTWNSGSIEVDAARGSPLHPMTAEQLDEKVRRLSGDGLTGALDARDRPAAEILALVAGE